MSCDKKKGEKCLRKSNILVYQQPSGVREERKPSDCKATGVRIPICTPQPKTIKICTGAELRRMCAPKVCPCPPVKKKMGFMRVMGFGLKSALAATLVYISYDMGIWGTTDDTQSLYTNACTIFGYPKEKKSRKWDPPSCEAESEMFADSPYHPFAHCEEPPFKAEDTYIKFKTKWNVVISYIFHGLSGFPWMGGKAEKKTLGNKATEC